MLPLPKFPLLILLLHYYKCFCCNNYKYDNQEDHHHPPPLLPLLLLLLLTLVRPGPNNLGICLMSTSDAKKELYLEEARKGGRGDNTTTMRRRNEL